MDVRFIEELVHRGFAYAVGGDVYFRVARPGENLDRARNQVELLRSMVSTL